MLERVLGRGAMGVVWRATQIALDRPVALKVLAPELAANVDFQRRFLREARLAARLRHPHVVIVHDAREELGVLLLSMDLVVGIDLAHVIQIEGRLPAKRATVLIEQIAGALDAAHAQGLVHRDVKPANVLIGRRHRDEHAYLTDFGLSTALNEATPGETTMAGAVMGTPDYMAPEQVRGERVDRRADVYSLGCMLFELLAERPPFRRDNVFATLFAHVDEPVPSLHDAAPEVPQAMAEVMSRALAKAPDDRFPSAGDLALAARTALAGQSQFGARRESASVARNWEGHVIVAGLGEAGSRLASGLHEAGYRVVVVEIDEANEKIARTRERGIYIIVGDAADPDLLHQARVADARYLIVTCGDDGRNVNIATVAGRECGTDQPITLTAFVHLHDLALLRTLTADALQRPGPRDTRLEFFNARAAGTGLLLQRHSALAGDDGRPVPSPRVCVVGDRSIASDLIVAIAAEWQTRRGSDNKLELVLVGAHAGRNLRELLSENPQLTDICEFDVRDADPQSARFQSGDVLLDAHGSCTITKLYVALEHESAALAAALGLRSQPPTRSVPIVVAVDDDEGPVANALRGGSWSFAEDVHAFGVLSAALTPTMLFRGVNETLARANHQRYLMNQHSAGVTDSISLIPWEDLPESLKNSNRRFADSIGSALEAIGYVLVPAPRLSSSPLLTRFTTEEVEHLARREHERWIADLMRDGWRFTRGEKDPVRKLHPLLVPWGDLTEPERNKDRDAVQAIPELLAGAGLSVILVR